MNTAAELFFVDANRLLYMLDTANPRKQGATLVWRDALWKHQAGRPSWQALSEFYGNAGKHLLFWHAPWYSPMRNGAR